MRLIIVVLVAAGAWTGGGALLVAYLDRAHEARLGEVTASARALLDEAKESLRLDARLLARDIHIVEHDGQWANFGSAHAIIAFYTGRRIERCYVLAPGGTPMAYPKDTTIPAFGPPDKPMARLGLLDGQAWMFGIAPFLGLSSRGGAVPGGVVILARRLEAFGATLTRLPARPILLVTTGDRAILRPAGTAEGGWAAVTRAPRVALFGEPWALRRLAEIEDGVLWTLVLEREHHAARRQVWRWAGAGDVVAVALAAWLAVRARRSPGA